MGIFEELNVIVNEFFSGIYIEVEEGEEDED